MTTLCLRFRLFASVSDFCSGLLICPDCPDSLGCPDFLAKFDVLFELLLVKFPLNPLVLLKFEMVWFWLTFGAVIADSEIFCDPIV